MSELDKIRDDVEKYYAETEAQHYKLVKDLRDQPLFTLDTLFKFAAMYNCERANGTTTGEKQCNLPVINPLNCAGCKYHNTTDDELCGTCGDTYKNKTT